MPYQSDQLEAPAGHYWIDLPDHQRFTSPHLGNVIAVRNAKARGYTIHEAFTLESVSIVAEPLLEEWTITEVTPTEAEIDGKIIDVAIEAVTDIYSEYRLNAMNVTRLREVARELSIPGGRLMRKAELVEAVLKAQS